MKKGATTNPVKNLQFAQIIALRNEKGSYNGWWCQSNGEEIIALRNEKGRYPFLWKN